MSIKNLYDMSKKDKKPVNETVVYSGSLNQLSNEHLSIQTQVDSLQITLDALKAHVDSLKDQQETQKTMKTRFNDLVDAFNKSTAEIQAVIGDISVRLNTVESALNIL